MTNKDNHGREQATAWYQSITEMVEKLHTARDEGDSRTIEEAEQEIMEAPLSVEVRSGWRSIGDTNNKPTEYRILLCTGGPAVQITGDLDQYGEPATARLQYQDWFAPWTDAVSADPAQVEEILLDFVRCFYFGEG